MPPLRNAFGEGVTISAAPRPVLLTPPAGCSRACGIARPLIQRPARHHSVPLLRHAAACSAGAVTKTPQRTKTAPVCCRSLSTVPAEEPAVPPSRCTGPGVRRPTLVHSSELPPVVSHSRQLSRVGDRTRRGAACSAADCRSRRLGPCAQPGACWETARVVPTTDLCSPAWVCQ